MTVRLLHNIGSLDHPNYNTRVEVNTCTDPLTFDGPYRTIFTNADAFYGKDVTIFVAGNHVGKDNAFDAGQPLEKFCTWDEIILLCRTGVKLGWHTWSHRDLTTLADDEIRKELTPPFPMKAVAYPYGKYDDRVIAIAKECGFLFGYGAGEHGDDLSPYTLKRSYL